MNVSVVICTCNRYESILETLHSILRNFVKPAEVLVVDQSDDPTRMNTIMASIESELVRYIHLGVKGQSIARNVGIEKSTGEIVAFTDDDAYVREDWIGSTLRTFEDKRFNTGIAGGVIIPVYHERNPDWTIPPQWEFVLPAYSQDGPMALYKSGYPPGVNYAIRRELVQTVGYFDEKMGLISGRKSQIFGDDTDYTVRTIKAGYKVVFNPESVVYHPVPLSRQTQEFLNRRLFSKGLTDIVIQYRSRRPRKARMLLDYVRRAFKLIRLQLTISEDPRIRSGELSLLKGQLAMIKAHLRHPDVFESELF